MTVEVYIHILIDGTVIVRTDNSRALTAHAAQVFRATIDTSKPLDGVIKVLKERRTL